MSGPPPLSPAEINRRFGYHPATPRTGPMFDKNRMGFIDLGLALNDRLPESREKSLAMTALQESLMWANAAVACNVTG